MKAIYFSIIPVIALGEVMPQSEPGRLAIETLHQKASAGDTISLIASLPNLESLWRVDPVSYWEGIKIDLQALIINEATIVRTYHAA